jgi:hypothetical protein
MKVKVVGYKEMVDFSFDSRKEQILVQECAQYALYSNLYCDEQCNTILNALVENDEEMLYNDIEKTLTVIFETLDWAIIDEYFVNGDKDIDCLTVKDIIDDLETILNITHCYTE